MYVRMYVCMYVCMFVCMYVRMTLVYLGELGAISRICDGREGIESPCVCLFACC